MLNNVFRAQLKLSKLTQVNLQRCMSAVAVEENVEETVRKRVKHKIPAKRATHMLATLRNEEYNKLRGNRTYDDFRAGDSIQVERLPFMSATEPEILKGLCIGITRRSSDTSLRMINVEHGTPVMRRIVLYNPLIQNIKILQKAFIHKGKKRVRRAKLYYMLKRDPESYTVV